MRYIVRMEADLDTLGSLISSISLSRIGSRIEIEYRGEKVNCEVVIRGVNNYLLMPTCNEKFRAILAEINTKAKLIPSIKLFRPTINSIVCYDGDIPEDEIMDAIPEQIGE